jgi:hypothetical protein
MRRPTTFAASEANVLGSGSYAVTLAPSRSAQSEKTPMFAPTSTTRQPASGVSPGQRYSPTATCRATIHAVLASGADKETPAKRGLTPSPSLWAACDAKLSPSRLRVNERTSFEEGSVTRRVR